MFAIFFEQSVSAKDFLHASISRETHFSASSVSDEDGETIEVPEKPVLKRQGKKKT